MARPTVLTPELQKKICDSIEAGNYAETSCQKANVSTSTYYRWLDLGRKETSGIHADFLAAVEAAEAVAEAAAVDLVQRGMQNDPRLAMTFLERRFPKRWQNRRLQPDEDAKDAAPAAVSIRFTDELDDEGVLIRTVERVESDGSRSMEVEFTDRAEILESYRRRIAAEEKTTVAPDSSQLNGTREESEAVAPPLIELTSADVRPPVRPPVNA